MQHTYRSSQVKDAQRNVSSTAIMVTLNCTPFRLSGTPSADTLVDTKVESILALLQHCNQPLQPDAVSAKP
jgi:hypothetical protein